MAFRAGECFHKMLIQERCLFHLRVHNEGFEVAAVGTYG